MTSSNRNIAFDAIKGIAIAAVVMYHYGLCVNGYLGVDIFLVIAGFFTAKSLWKNVDKKAIGGGKFLWNRALRLLPLLLLAEIVLLLYGVLMMLPDDFENVSQSIIASNLFSNNVLADITTKNYWDVVNEYKPLMHTWYLGVLMQFYVVFVIIDIIVARLRGQNPGAYILFWSIISALSLAIYLLNFPDSSKFYQIPFRLFEFGIGSLTFYLPLKYDKTPDKTLSGSLIVIAYLSLLAILFLNIDFIENKYMLLMTVLLASILTYLLPRSEFSNNKVWFNRPLAVIGAASFSIYLWHQIVFALSRYSFTSDLKSVTVFIIVMLIIAFLTILSYRYFEQAKISRRFILTFTSLFIIVNASAFFVYMRAGVFYDIPELEITTDNIQRGIWGAYCDRGYIYDKPFDKSDKPKWIVVGNSFGRDFVNIISESSVKDSIDLSYTSEYTDDEHIHRIHEADVIFISSLGISERLVNDIESKMSPEAQLVIVGEKNFGMNNGQIFRNRKKQDYLKSVTNMEPGYDERNEKFKSLYTENFIDLIGIVKQHDGKVRVFSEDGRYISQDCRHLTRAGAKFYADKIDWSQYLKPHISH